MRFFEGSSAWHQLDPALPEAAVRIEMAWALRQSDPAKARVLLADLPADLTPFWARRASLIVTEHLWLAGSPDQAQKAFVAVLEQAKADGDELTCADTAFLLAALGSSNGDAMSRDARLAEALVWAEKAGDDERHQFFSLVGGAYLAFRDPAAARERWPAVAPTEGTHASLLGQWTVLQAVLSHLEGDIAGAVPWFLKALDYLLESGQIVSAIVTAANLSESFHMLNDPEAGLAWAQRSLDLARPHGWPMALGHALTRVAENLRKMHRFETVQSLLDEAWRLYQNFQGSRTFGLLLAEMGETAKATGNPSRGLERFTELELLSADVGSHDLRDLQSMAAEGKAACLLALGRLAEARSEALRGLSLLTSPRKIVREVDLHHILADIELGQENPTAARDRLELAIQAALAIGKYQTPATLFWKLAQAHDAAGDKAQAYAAMVRGREAAEAQAATEAANRATALQIRIESERSRAELTEQRTRAELLERSHSLLEHLTMVGQELTSQLDTGRVYETIDKHVRALMPVMSFAVYLADPEKQQLNAAFARGSDPARLPPTLSLTEDHPFVRCVVEGTEQRYVDSETRALTHTAPLRVRDRVFGCLLLVTGRRRDDEEPDALILRNLSASLAIALDNALAYSRLSETRKQLVEQEKFAALGSLVAGIAHELNTPLGNGLLLTSNLSDKTQTVVKAFQGGTLSRSELAEFLTEVETSCRLLGGSLTVAAGLVRSFKQVAVDRTTEQRRVFNLAETSLDVGRTFARAIETAGHRLVVDIPEGLMLDAYPGPFGQIVGNLIQNALVHAFPGRRGGTMRLTATEVAPSLLEIVFSDDGVGIAPEHQSRIFDPFFTTRLGQGGSGLGLSICYNMAASLFGGTLAVASAPGEGSRFLLRIPVQAP